MYSPAAIIELKDIAKRYQTDTMETHALQAIDLTIRRGEFAAIAGPSGCGKSTLLAILGLLDTPTRGEYFLEGREVSGFNAEERTRIRGREIGFIFQAFNLIGDLTVRENIELPLLYRGLASDVREQRVIGALKRVDLLHRAAHFPHQLSGGQQQRVAVARAVAGDPALLLADEPTGNLDSSNGEAVLELLQGLHADGATICMVTHDERFAERASRQITLLDGRILQ
ncbi:MAG: ABC transporter ATP-binding protein [Gemmatimonas sp.]|jgi:putative ABC transport system ATP-binding protein|nr:ABC transporter ATP-binding protein [Gemmatimonas sp.]